MFILEFGTMNHERINYDANNFAADQLHARHKNLETSSDQLRVNIERPIKRQIMTSVADKKINTLRSCQLH